MSPAKDPLAQETPPTYRQYLPTQKLASVSRFASFTLSKRDKNPPIIFPPPSWNLDETTDNGNSSLDARPNANNERPQTDIPVEEAPEPISFAERIRTLIDLLPLPVSTSTASVAVDSINDDIAEGPPTPGVDWKLSRLLSSENVMNGSIARGRESVWAILERLRYRGGETEARVGSGGGSEEPEDVMVCSPLEPRSDSEVKLADSEIVIDDADEVSRQETTDPKHEARSSEPKTPKAHRIWHPSTTQLSLRITWWGYRLYLPPPVIATLDNVQFRAARRGAMITAALQWILSKVPVTLAPPQLRPALMIMQRLTPMVKYVGIFVAWSWGAVRARDEGTHCPRITRRC